MSAKPCGGTRPLKADLARCESGAAILEFVLALPILLALLGAAFEIGRAVLIRQTMIEAVRGGARTLARVPDPRCTPKCSPDAAHAAAATADRIVAASGVARSSVSVTPSDNAQAGTVTMRADLTLDVDLLRLVGLDPVLQLEATHQERRIGE